MKVLVLCFLEASRVVYSLPWRGPNSHVEQEKVKDEFAGILESHLREGRARGGHPLHRSRMQKPETGTGWATHPEVLHGIENHSSVQPKNVYARIQQ